MQSAAWFISPCTAVLASSAAMMMPAATNASSKAYYTEEMALSSAHSLTRSSFIWCVVASIQPPVNYARVVPFC